MPYERKAKGKLSSFHQNSRIKRVEKTLLPEIRLTTDMTQSLWDQLVTVQRAEKVIYREQCPS